MFGKIRRIKIGNVGSFAIIAALAKVGAKRPLCPMFAKEPRGKVFKVANRHAPRPRVISGLGILAIDIDKKLGLAALGHALHANRRSDKHQNEINPKRPDNPVRQMVLDSHTQQRLRPQDTNAKRPVRQDRHRQKPALDKAWQQQGIAPQHKPGNQAKPHARPVDRFKVNRRQNRRAELRHRGKGQKPDISQRVFFR